MSWCASSIFYVKEKGEIHSGIGVCFYFGGTMNNLNPIVKVNLGTIAKVQEFVKTVSKFRGNFDLISGNYMVDAKSILGIFSLNYRDDIDLRIIDAHNEMDEVMEALRPFMTTERVELTA